MIQTRTAFAIAILLAVLLPLTIMAQTETPPAQGQGPGMGEHHGHMGHMGEPPTAQAHLDHLARMLNLTDEQKAKVKPILEDTNTQAQSIRQDPSLSPRDRFTKMRELHEKAMAKVRELLTPEQQTKLDQMQPMHQHMGGGKGMGQGQGMGPKEGQQQTPPPQP